MSQTSYAFFLGGHDLEMVTIRELLEQHVSRDVIHDKGLPWGARVDAYAAELEHALAAGQTPVLIELGGAEEWVRAVGGRGVIADHHSDRAGQDRPSSLQQIFELLGRPNREWS